MSEIYRCLNCGFDHDKYPADNKCQSCRSNDPLKKIEAKKVALKKITLGDFRRPSPKPEVTPPPPIRRFIPPTREADHTDSSLPPTHSETIVEFGTIERDSPAHSGSSSPLAGVDRIPWCISINRKINIALLMLTAFVMLLLYMI